MVNYFPSKQSHFAFHTRALYLFITLSVLIHGFILYNWKEPLQFDFGGQQLNQQTLQIALRTPTPRHVEVEPAEKPVEQAVEPPPPPVEEVAVKQEQSVEVIEEPPPQPEPKPDPDPEPEPESESEPEPEPQVIQQPSPPAPKPKKQHVPFQQKKAVKPVTTKPVKSVAAEKVIDPTPVKPVTDPKPAPKSAPEEKTAEEPETKLNESEATQQSIAMIRRLIQGELGRHFQYPRVARRRGWEGKVQLEFTVLPDGAITNIRIMQGSQYKILDRSAVNTMTRIHHLKQISEGMLRAPVRMEIPIIYQLSNR